MTTLTDNLGKEKPMASPLNSAHFYSRRADNHLKYGRYDDAIKNHAEAVAFLSEAITQSTIPTNIEYLKLQRKYHENMQQIIGRQKCEFDHFLLLNGLKIMKKPIQVVDDSRIVFQKNFTTIPIADICDKVDDDKFSLFAGEFKIDQSNSINVVDKITVNTNSEKDNDCDDNEFFSLVSDLKIDENNVRAMDQISVDQNDDSDNEEYFSLL